MRACNDDESSKHGATDPWEVFTQLVILVVEGRTPGGDRGYHAGPHCFRPQQPIGNRHECNLNSTICLKADMLLKQLRLMWEVGVGVSVEVLLAPDCRHGVDIANTLDTTSAPLPNLRLLEQWNFTISDRRMISATASGWALVAAVRSYLHFSQLSAWLSSSGGSSPPNVLYRLAVTSPMFCSKFEGIPEVHSFPIAKIGSETCMKVVVRTLPRTDKIPNIVCEEVHTLPSRDGILGESSRSTVHQRITNELSVCEADCSVIDQVHRTDEDLRRSVMKARLTDAVLVRRSESPDTQLGESLLDPPNSMSGIPRRFQSPSRSGSPSLETPEHLLCKARQCLPSHARPPGTVPFCQPLVIPSCQPLNPFPWTRTCYPAFNPNVTNYQESYIPKAFNIPQDKQLQDSPSSSTLGKNPFHNSKSVCIRPTPQYLWPKSPVPETLDRSSKQEQPGTVFGPLLHNIDGPVAGSSKDSWMSLKSDIEKQDYAKSGNILARKKMDCDKMPSAFTYTASRPKEVESPQGRKRKVIHKRESPKKRESPPHCSRLDYSLSPSPNILSDQLWPRCSLPGKHLCTSTEDISDICDKAATAVDIMPKTSQIGASRSSVPRLFDLTPKETKEILDVLRQSTPVPPLRINRAEIEQNPAEYLFNPKAKLSKTPQNTDEKIKWKNVALNKSEKANPTTSAPHCRTLARPWSKELHFAKARKCNEPSTSANYSCDNSIKKPLASHQSLSLPSCSTGVKRKLLNEPQEPAKDCIVVTSCIQAKTVTEKTNSFTAISHPARSPRHMSIILGRKSDLSNQARKKRSSPTVSDQEEESECPKAKRYSSLKDEEPFEGRNGISDTGKRSIKSESLLKRLIKPTNLSLTRFTDNISSYDRYQSEVEEFAVARKSPDIEKAKKSDSNVVDDCEVEDICRSRGVPIPTARDQVSFRRSFDSATNLVFHNKTGLPLTSSPAPMRKGNSFDYDSSLISVAAIKCALRSCDNEQNDKLIKISSPSETAFKPIISLSAPATVTCSNLLGNFEESVLNGRLEPFSTVHGFKAEIAASGSFCPSHVAKPVTVFFYTLCDNYQMSSPYMGHVDLGKKGYQVPCKGTVQVTLFNPHGTVVKMFVVMYDLSDMPPNSKTFLRQRTLNMPVGETDSHPNAHQWLRYLIHLRFASSRSGKIYLHTDIRMMIFRKADVDAALLHQTDVSYEVRSFTHGPTNPRFSPRK